MSKSTHSCFDDVLTSTGAVDGSEQSLKARENLLSHAYATQQHNYLNSLELANYSFIFGIIAGKV